MQYEEVKDGFGSVLKQIHDDTVCKFKVLSVAVIAPAVHTGCKERKKSPESLFCVKLLSKAEPKPI